MNFFQQIGAEAKNMLRSKFILVFAIIFFVLTTIVIPVGGYIINEYFGYNYYRYDEEYVIIDGVEYENNNNFTYGYSEITRQLEWMEQSLSPEAIQYGTELSDILLDFYALNIPYAAQSERDYDYRSSLSYDMQSKLVDIFVLQQDDQADQDLADALYFFNNYSDYLLVDSMNGGVMYSEYGGYTTSQTVNDDGSEVREPLTSAEKQDIIAELEAEIERFNELMATDDFSIYVEIETENLEEQVISNQERIEQLEKDVIADPSQEEYISDEIAYLKAAIETINAISLPQIQYRLENNILPSDGSWQSNALSEIEWKYERIISHDSDIYTEQEYQDNFWMAEQYGEYEDYLAAMEMEKQGYEKDLFIAQSSLDSGKPDMVFVQAGARNQLYGTFYLVMVVVMFGVLVGGWCLASEFQNGTVRLMMIRPRSRMKILFSKYLAGLALVLALYLAIFLVMFVVSGIRGGFGDYAFPNYTATGPVNFFVTFIGDLLAVFVSSWFLFTLGFMFSAVARNTAVSIIVPTVIYVASFIYMNTLSYAAAPPDFLAYTPVPYLLMQDYINTQDYGYVEALLEKGFPIGTTTGIIVLLVYGLIFLGVGTLVFKKRDVTN